MHNSKPPTWHMQSNRAQVSFFLSGWRGRGGGGGRQEHRPTYCRGSKWDDLVVVPRKRPVAHLPLAPDGRIEALLRMQAAGFILQHHQPLLAPPLLQADHTVNEVSHVTLHEKRSSMNMYTGQPPSKRFVKLNNVLWSSNITNANTMNRTNSYPRDLSTCGQRFAHDAHHILLHRQCVQSTYHIILVQRDSRLQHTEIRYSKSSHTCTWSKWWLRNVLWRPRGTPRLTQTVALVEPRRQLGPRGP